MSSTVFTKIIKKELPAHFLYEDEHCIAILDRNPAVKGQSLVIPKHEIDYAFDLDDDVLTGLILYTKKIAKKLDGFFEDVGRTAMVFEGFGVDHIHAKLFPMHGTMQVHENWKAVNSNVDKYFEQYEGYISSHDFQRANDEELALLAEQIRAFE